jgi:hypothetical protein
MLNIIELIMEIIAALILIGIAVYKIIDAIIYLKYKEDHKDEDI